MLKLFFCFPSMSLWFSILGRVFWLKLGIENSDPGCPIRIYKINFEEVTNVFQRQYEAVIGDNLRPAEEGAILSQAALHFLELRVFWEGHLHDDKFLGKRVCLHLKNQLFSSRRINYDVYPQYYQFWCATFDCKHQFNTYSFSVDSFSTPHRTITTFYLMQQHINPTSYRYSIFRNPLFDSESSTPSLHPEPQIKEEFQTKRVQSNTGCPNTSTDSQHHSITHKRRIFSLDNVGKGRSRTITPFEPIVNRNSRNKSRSKKHKIFQGYNLEKPRLSLPPERKQQPAYRFTYNSNSTEPTQVIYQNRQLPFPLQPTVVSRPIKREVFRVIDVTDQIMTPEQFSRLIWESRQTQRRRKTNKTHAHKKVMEVTGRFS